MWPYKRKIVNKLIEDKEINREEILKIAKEKLERIKIEKDRISKDAHDYAISEEGIFYDTCWKAKICPRCGCDITYKILIHAIDDNLCKNCNYNLMDLYDNVPIKLYI